uniref:Phospholipid scramblase n=1 Tax=Magallana gigas TaxID=29159 RepID=K1P4Y9_MAGGI
MEKIPITSQPGSEALPSGLKDLESLEEITVHQHLEAGDMSECYARQCLGAMRAFVLKFSNQEGQDLIRLRRPLRCPCGVCWWWCCCVQELSIESPPGQEIGVIMEERCCCPVYKIIDENESVVFRIGFSCCLCKLCSDVVIPIYDGRGEQLLAEIKKSSAGDWDLQPLRVQDKILLLGASFLIDFNFFEKQQRSCC